MLAGRWLKRIFTVRRMEGHQRNARTVAVGNAQQFRVDFCATWAPRGRDFFHQQGPPTVLNGERLGEIGWRTDDQGLTGHAAQEGHEEGSDER